MKIEAVLFDLDGTLADTAIDLGRALNALLRKHGLPEKNIDDIRPIASHGVNGLIKMGVGIDSDHPYHQRWRQEFLSEYERCFDQDTELFNGVNNLIESITEKGMQWGIITNKLQRFTDRLVSRLDFSVSPAIVVSGDTCAEAKPSTKPMFYACERIQVNPKNCIYVGDAERDMLAGKNAGMTTVLANWGYIAENDDTEKWLYNYHIEHPIELLNYL